MDQFHKNSRFIKFSRIFFKIGIVTGFLLSLFFLVMFITSVTSNLYVDDTFAEFIMIFSVYILFFLFGIYIISLSFKILKAIKNIPLYETMIRSDEWTDIAQLAAQLNKSCPIVKKELSIIIKQKYIEGTFNQDGSKVIWTTTPNSEIVISETPLGDTGAVTCRNCGATNAANSQTPFVCEYCGSPLKYKKTT